VKHLLRALLLWFLMVQLVNAQSPSTGPDLVLDGTVKGSQHETYFEIPFEVPAGVHRISVDFRYTGKEERTVLNLGVADPDRFRGNSGGNKSHFTISESDATPSYLPGAIPKGKWKLLISVPNIRPQVVAAYHAEIRFNASAEESGFAQAPLAEGTRWYRGDLHMHTAHSDGSCLSQNGKKVPCPLFMTVQTATLRGLDFIAITDHNTDSQYDSMRELQPYFDKLLLIPGREMTTFWGHFNVFGVTQYMDYRVAAHDGLDVNAVVRDAIAKGGIAAVNHAESPTGEQCMGCGWQPSHPVDMSQFTGVEVVNGGRAMLSNENFWEKQLSAGHRLTAIGGSDNHNAQMPIDEPGSIGWPTTVVEAKELSVTGILDGIRAGRVFIDLTASHDKVVDLEADDGDRVARMGGDLHADAGQTIALKIRVAACAQAVLRLLVDGKVNDALPASNVAGADETQQAKWISDGGRHWLRAEVRDDKGHLMLVSNPIYINFAGK
jgi:hypothetical protein